MSPLTADSSAFFGGCDFDFDPVSPEVAYCDTDREFSANFDRQASATDSVLFPCLSPPKANKTVSFFVLFHQEAMQSGILFLVSIERGTSCRVYHRRPWLSDMSQLGGGSLSVPCAPWLWPSESKPARTHGL